MSFLTGRAADGVGAHVGEIAHEEGIWRLSGYGWGLGYFGGLLTTVKVKRSKHAARQPDIEDRAVS